MKSVRSEALAALLRHEAAGQYADRTLTAALERNESFSPRDKALFTALFYGVIERKITLDAVIDSLSKLSPSAIEPQVRMLLRLGLYQLLYLDRVPDHAAINETVELAEKRSRGFVNALLRQFLRSGKEIPLPKEPIPALSVTYSVSEPLAAALTEAYGLARATEILRAFLAHPPVTLRVNTARLTREAFLETYGGTPTRNAPYGVKLKEGKDAIPLVKEGLAFVEDEASQIALHALRVEKGMRVADLCAAPGSKSFGAALYLQGEGEVESFDLHENKLSLIRRGGETLGLSSLIKVGVGDARRATPETHGTFHRVIADVPCSGFGVIAKKPDIRYKSVAETRGLLPTQAAILAAAATLVKEGGLLLYSTCTILPEENEKQVEAFLKTHPDFALSPFTVGEKRSNGMLLLLPDTDGTDGFFMAVFRHEKRQKEWKHD